MSLYNILSHPQMGPIIGHYADANEDFPGAVTSLKNEEGAGKDRQLSVPPHAYLVKEFGLTGVCMAYAVKTVDWVAKHGGLPGQLPPLMASRPTEEIRHLEKLLILSVYKAIPKGMDPKKITRQTPEIVNAVMRDYVSLQQSFTGARPVALFPGPDFAKTTLMANHKAVLERASPRDPRDAHFIFIMNSSNAAHT